MSWKLILSCYKNGPWNWFKVQSCSSVVVKWPISQSLDSTFILYSLYSLEMATWLKYDWDGIL